ncbi:hypothetical protein GCM10028805_46080 [Spirosoma harenae]
MKKLSIRFFSSAENSAAKDNKIKEPKAKKVVLTGYISTSGKVVFPTKTVADLGIDLESAVFKVGMQEGKRKAKSIYLVPATDQADTFQFEKAAKSYTLALPFILKRSGVDFEKGKYNFTIRFFNHDDATALELQLDQEEATPKAPYTGKPRGRKPKSQEVNEQ